MVAAVSIGLLGRAMSGQFQRAPISVPRNCMPNRRTCDEKILLVGSGAEALKSQLLHLDYRPEQIHHHESTDQAIKIFERISPTLVIVVLRAPELHGLQFVNWIRELRTSVVVVAASFDTSASVSASAIRSGAIDFIGLPASAERIQQSIQMSLARSSAGDDNRHLRHPLFDESNGFIGAECSMRDVAKLMISAAKSDASVFITGENGTGKEVCAQLIHQFSQRCEQPIIPINCAAIPSGLAESEVFGHVKGAFTGAIEDREGVASRADRSTLFLDEIGEMDLELQSKLLRFVQTGRFTKVGSSHEQAVDVRFICATNRDPLEQIEERSFRQDLYYRLNVIHIHLPPLRERSSDIMTFARHFLQQFVAEEEKQFTGFSDETEKLLMAYSWPGNVRELQNVIRSMVVLHDGDLVMPSMLPMAVINEKGDRRRRREHIKRDNQMLIERLKDNIKTISSAPTESAVNDPSGTILPLDDVINQAIREAIEYSGGNVVDAARQLGVSASTLYRKIKD